MKVRRKLVDATYVESSIPSTHTPAYEVDDGVRLVPPNDLVDLDGGAAGYTVIGAGKTAMDTCNFLMDEGVASDKIRWIRLATDGPSTAPSRSHSSSSAPTCICRRAG